MNLNKEILLEAVKKTEEQFSQHPTLLVSHKQYQWMVEFYREQLESEKKSKHDQEFNNKFKEELK